MLTVLVSACTPSTREVRHATGGQDPESAQPPQAPEGPNGEAVGRDNKSYQTDEPDWSETGNVDSLDTLRTRLLATPEVGPVWAELSVVAIRQRLALHARWAAERALEINPGNPKLYPVLAAACYAEYGACSREEALQYLQQAHALSPDDRDVKFELARGYELAGQTDQALLLYDQLVREGHTLATGARYAAAPKSASDLTGDGVGEVIWVKGRTVEVFDHDEQLLLNYEPPGDAPVEARVVWLQDRLPSLWVQSADDQGSYDVVFGSDREGRLSRAWEDTSRRAFYDRFNGWLVKTISLRPGISSGVHYAYQAGRFQSIGESTILTIGNLPTAQSLEHLEVLLSWSLGEPEEVPEFVQPEAWRHLVQAVSPGRTPDTTTGLFFLMKPETDKAVMLVLQDGKEVVRGQALVTHDDARGWRLEAVEFQ